MAKTGQPPAGWTTLSAFSISRQTVAKLDAWLEVQNKGRRGPQLTRNALIRGLLDWAGDVRPDWEARALEPAAQELPVKTPQKRQAKR